MNETNPRLLIDHAFGNEILLHTALTHRSYSKDNNERLEYLGDAILGFLIAEALYRKFPSHSEGVLTRLRANLVNREALAGLARSVNIGDFLKLGQGEMRSGGRRRDSILANTMEAIIGAVYLDSDLDTCRLFVRSLYRELMDKISPDNLSKDPKTELQEYLQARKQHLPTYEIIAENGQAHDREFAVACHVDEIGREIIAHGKSKRAAEQSAAELALRLLQS